MSFESDSGNEFLFTDITFERLDASVTSHVSLQFLLCAERSIAVTAFERFFARVNSLKQQKSKKYSFRLRYFTVRNTSRNTGTQTKQSDWPKNTDILDRNGLTIWDLRPVWTANDFPQTSQLKGFSPVWVRR